MKLLTWMHRKFRQGNGGETLKEYSPGQQFLDDHHLFQKQNQGRQRRSSFTSVETTNMADFERKASSADEYPEYFEGFLAIGTLGTEAVITEPDTPTFAVSFEKLTEGEADVTENELRLINDELERELAVEATDDGWTDSSGRNSHVSNGRISHASTITLSGKPLEIPESTGGTGNNLMHCPLQEYLLGSAVEPPEKAPAPKKENRTSLGELFERHKAEEMSEAKYKRGDKREDKEGDKTASTNLMKKILMKKKNALHSTSKSSSASSRGTAEPASTETKLCKILQKFHKKVHPECLLSTEKSDKMHKTGSKNMMPCSAGYKDDHTFPDERTTAFSQREGQNGYTLRRNSISSPIQFTEDGSDSNGSRECWIKTDADYLVLEL